jgi:hypothetical protein
VPRGPTRGPAIVQQADFPSSDTCLALTLA